MSETNNKPKLMTLCLVHQGNKVLLGLKKRGFGQGRWNGFGGKVQGGETVEMAAIRELGEEACIIPLDLTQIAVIDFEFLYDRSFLEVHVFKVTRFEGEPCETEEMKPQWFSVYEIPFDQMWSDDIHWMHLFLANKMFKARFVFDKDDKIVDMNIREQNVI